ncbi:Uncharacterised protein [Chlamydia abortus]|nr:Uncharacterised protein [Chlamydia abortus]
MFLIFYDFQFSCPIQSPTVDISKFSTFFSFLAIFHVLQWTFLNFPIFQFSSPYFTSYIVHFSFFTFFSDFVIFQVVKWMFLIFHDFQFSCHIPRRQWTFLNFNLFQFSSPYFTSMDISKLSNFFSFPRHISRPKVCISHFP